MRSLRAALRLLAQLTRYVVSTGRWWAPMVAGAFALAALLIAGTAAVAPTPVSVLS